MLRLFPTLALAATLTGCVVRGNGGHVQQASCDPPAFTNSHDAYPIYHVEPDVSTSFDGSDNRPTYALTASSGSVFRLVWSDPVGAATCFQGLITIDGNFSQGAAGYSGHENIVFNQSNQIAFSSIPGSNLDGVDFVADTQPVYIDAFVDSGTSTTIYYTDSISGFETDTGNQNVAAFTSP
ncbi:MAG: hypothetical protein ABI321_12755 [Polyangia bacterium]